MTPTKLQYTGKVTMSISGLTAEFGDTIEVASDEAARLLDTFPTMFKSVPKRSKPKPKAKATEPTKEP